MTDLPNSIIPAELSPAERLVETIHGFILARAVYAAAKLGIADHLCHGPQNVEALANLTGANEGALYRLLRTLAGSGIFTENEPQCFTLTPMGELLRKDHPASLRGYAKLFGEDWHYRPWGELLHSIETGEAAFDRTWGMSGFDYMRRHPEVGRLAEEVMTSLTRRCAPILAATCPLDGAKRIVDVGGGSGVLLGAILEAHPELHGTLVDLPEVIQRAQSAPFLRQPHQAGRVEWTGASIFTALPEGAEVYLLKNILHNWDDDQAIQILKQCRAAMPPEGRVLVIERIIPPGNAPSISKTLDLEMLVMLGGRERTEQEYAKLFSSAGLRFSQVIPNSSPWTVIEAVLANGG